MKQLSKKYFSNEHMQIIAGIIGVCNISIQDRVKVADTFFTFTDCDSLKKGDFIDMMLNWANDDDINIA